MKTKLGRLMVLALALGAAAFASAQQWPVGEPTWYYPEPSQMMWMWSGGLGFGWIFPLLVLGFMIAVGVGIFLMVHRTHGHTLHHWMPWHMGAWGSPSGDPTRSALQILNERFAKGEIPRQEYEEKKAAILSSSPR
jgi:putative membrane protein